MKSVMYDGEPYGIPTNNETMAMIWNADIFQRAGLDPESPPKTWDDVDRLLQDDPRQARHFAGYGLVAKQNAGNTPFRFMPQLWAYGGGALDEAADAPTYKTVGINNDGAKEALQASYDMYVRDKSVPVSALTNTQNENQAPFIAGQLAMMIAHPAEYAKMVDLASKATGADKEVADEVVANMRYGLIPEGPAGARSCSAARTSTSSRTSTSTAGWTSRRRRRSSASGPAPNGRPSSPGSASNPGNLRGFKTEWMKERLDTIKFLDVTTSMLPNGIPFPVVPEATEIMNIIVPDMLQNALTETMTVDEAADDAASKIEHLMEGK